MRLGLLISLAVWALIGLGVYTAVAHAEDGAPSEPYPTSCILVNLDSGEDYSSGSFDQAPQCVDGGSGSNNIWTFGGRDWVNGKGGTDPIHGGDAQDILYGGNEGDNIEGDAGNDFIYAGCPGGCDQSGAQFFNLIHGGDGNDIIGARNNVGNDVLYGGSGFDTCYVDRNDETHSCEDKRIG